MDLLRAARRVLPGRDPGGRSLAEIDAALAREPDLPVCTWFAEWPIADYAGIYLRDLSAYPALERRLPRMPSAEVQRHWNGSDGETLMKGSAAQFMAIVKETYERLRGPLRDARVLDYGAGWGRLTRMFLLHIPEDQIDAVDAMPESVAQYDDLGFRRPSRLVAAKPTTPLEGSYDLVVLHSVLTHLPLDHIEAIMASIRPATRGLIVVTSRPPEFWDRAGEDALRDQHDRTGYAHRSAGDAWGDTTMTTDFLARHAPGWDILEVDERMRGWLQTVVWLAPA